MESKYYLIVEAENGVLVVVDPGGMAHRIDAVEIKKSVNYMRALGFDLPDFDDQKVGDFIVGRLACALLGIAPGTQEETDFKAAIAAKKADPGLSGGRPMGYTVSGKTGDAVFRKGRE